MALFHRKLPVCVLLACLGLATACNSPGYNDNPSQRMADAHVGCPVATDFLAVYFTAHVQLTGEGGDAKTTKQLFRPYCHEIPTVGEVFFTIDLAGLEPRKTPLAIHVVEQEFTGYDASLAESFKDLRTVSEIAPQRYAKGFVEGSFTADKPGYYAIYLTREGEPDPLRIALTVGIDSGAGFLIAHSASLLGIAAALALAGFAGVRHGRKDKAL